MSGLKFFFCNKKLIYKKTTQSAVLWFFSNFLHFLGFFDFDINTLMMTQQSMFFMFKVPTTTAHSHLSIRILYIDEVSMLKLKNPNIFRFPSDINNTNQTLWKIHDIYESADRPVWYSKSLGEKKNSH